MSWKEYINNTKNKPAHPLLREAVTCVKSKKNALDMGAGSLNDTRAILESGFSSIDVVDIEEDVRGLIEDLSTKLPSTQCVSFYNQSFESYVFPKAKYDLINAHYSLPFIAPNDFSGVWSKILTSLKYDGIFVGTFFGIEDEWNDGKKLNITFHSKEEVSLLFSQSCFRLIKFEEKNNIGTMANGTKKHWHVFHVIAMRVNV